MLDAFNPQFFPGIFCALNLLLAYPVYVCTTERSSFSALKHIKTHLYKDMDIDVDEDVNQLGGANQRQLQLLFD